eukprot:SAG22_NODE_152_length_17377_cov_191.856928_19_plen_109_part_00
MPLRHPSKLSVHWCLQCTTAAGVGRSRRRDGTRSAARRRLQPQNSSIMIALNVMSYDAMPFNLYKDAVHNRCRQRPAPSSRLKASACVTAACWAVVLCLLLVNATERR